MLCIVEVVDENIIYWVGLRLRNQVPFTIDSELPVIVPPKQRFTLLAMEESQLFSHAGQDGTEFCLTEFSMKLASATGVDMTGIKEKFVNDAEKSFTEIKKWLLSELKDSSSVDTSS